MELKPEDKHKLEALKAAMLANFLDVCPKHAGYVEAAEAGGFHDIVPNQLNCSQTIVRFALSVLGYDPALVSVARYCGAGVARTGHICGALSGTAIALGIRDFHLGEQWADATVAADEDHAVQGTEEASHLRADAAVAANVDRLQRMFEDFRNEFGGTTCKELTGYDDLIGVEDYNRFREDEISQRCADYLAWAFDRLYEML